MSTQQEQQGQTEKFHEEEQDEAGKETDSNQGKESHTPADKQKFAYEVAMKQLRIHAPLIWRRNAFFLVANTALIAYAVKYRTNQDSSQSGVSEVRQMLAAEKESNSSISHCLVTNDYYHRREIDGFDLEGAVISIMGLVLAIAWMIITKYGQKIQREWRKVAMKFEEDYFANQDSPLREANKILREGKEGNSVSITSVILAVNIIMISVWIFIVILTFLHLTGFDLKIIPLRP